MSASGAWAIWQDSGLLHWRAAVCRGCRLLVRLVSLVAGVLGLLLGSEGLMVLPGVALHQTRDSVSPSVEGGDGCGLMVRIK